MFHELDGKIQIKVESALGNSAFEPQVPEWFVSHWLLGCSNQAG